MWQPQRNIEILAGTPPGGGQDRPARALMKVMASAGIVTVPMKLSNVVGKGGGAAWDALRKHNGDPHVLSINSGPLLANHILGVCDYNHTAFTPVANLYSENLVFIVPAQSPIRDAKDFLARLQGDGEVPRADRRDHPDGMLHGQVTPAGLAMGNHLPVGPLPFLGEPFDERGGVKHLAARLGQRLAGHHQHGLGRRAHRAGDRPASSLCRPGDRQPAVAQSEDEEASRHLARIAATGLFARMLYRPLVALAFLLALLFVRRFRDLLKIVTAFSVATVSAGAGAGAGKQAPAAAAAKPVAASPAVP